MTLSIVYCGKQNIALRGNVESTEDDENNPRNFLALQKFRAKALQYYADDPPLRH